MKVAFFLYLIICSYIFCSPNSNEFNTLEANKKRKEQIENLYKCLNELATDNFKQIVNENKGKKFGEILKSHKVSLTKQDKDAIKECRKKIYLNSKVSKEE